MPVFDTPDPIAVTIELGAGDVRVVASARRDTAVEVRPSNPSKRDDVAAAEQTRVDFDAGRLLVRAPRSWRRYSWFTDGGSVDVRIELPEGSRLTGTVAAAALRATGRLGNCRFDSPAGAIHLDQVATAHLRTGMGDVTADDVGGDVEVTTGSGSLLIGVIAGSAVIKNSNGDTTIAEVAGNVRVRAGNGSIGIDRAHAAVSVQTANGDIRLGEVSRASVSAETSRGDVEIGMREGVAAWLDLHTQFGRVRNDLAAAVPLDPSEDAVEVRARTSFGNVTVHRARQPVTAASRREA